MSTLFQPGIRGKKRTATLCLCLSLFVAASNSHGQNHAAPAANTQASSGPSIALTPAVILLQAEPGQSTTQSLTVENRTSGQFSFEMEALDVVVRDGKRTFVRVGEIPEGIARSAVFAPKLVVLEPGNSATVHVTVTVPPNPAVRAIVALFRAQTVIVGSNGVGMTGSLGALLTFTLSKKFHMENSVPGAVNVSSAKTFSLSQSLVNTGTEPVVPKGVLAIVSASGMLIGKMPLTTQRLLPGEQMEFRTEYARAE